MSESTIDWPARMVFSELLALSFAYPDESLVEALSTGEYSEALEELTERTGITLDPSVAEALQGYVDGDDESILHNLRVEATRLFVGSPKPVTAPYEGVWRAQDEGVQALLFVNPHSMAVERFMRECGVGQAEGKNEPLDHVATELEFLEYLTALQTETIELETMPSKPEDGWDGTYQRFFAEHIESWVPRFAEAVVRESREPFYRAAASILQAFCVWHDEVE